LARNPADAPRAGIVNSELTPLRVSAVSFLNTKPLIWGFRDDHSVQLRFEVPSACAESLAAGTADIGIIPVIEMDRQKLPYIPGLGIASDGPVRSIFLVSRVPAEQIKTLAVDTSSRTSVELARIVLAARYRTVPHTIPHPPDLDRMLAAADAALIIGDSALRLDPAALPWHVYDLGAEWKIMTGLPMVYALWSGPRALEVADLFQSSYRVGRESIDEIVEREAVPLGFSAELAHDYLTHHIQFELGPEHEKGLSLFLKMASELG
jgi:chorismate dehydratase